MISRYRLSPTAVEDISRIWEYGYGQWDETQADAYYTSLFECFAMIAKQPMVYSIAQFLSALTSKRWELIEWSRSLGTVSIYALATSLTRDYKNIYKDVSWLRKLGITEKCDGVVCVPYSEISVQLKLVA